MEEMGAAVASALETASAFDAIIGRLKRRVISYRSYMEVIECLVLFSVVLGVRGCDFVGRMGGGKGGKWGEIVLFSSRTLLLIIDVILTFVFPFCNHKYL